MRRGRLGRVWLAAALLVTACATRVPVGAPGFIPCEGDLLFQDLDGPLCAAIEAVTDGVDGAEFSHVGVVSRVERGARPGDAPRVTVLEAIGAGVVETPLETFLARSHDAAGRPKVLVGRLGPPWSRQVPRAIAVGEGFLGFPYDAVYRMENSAFYCSELVYEMYREAATGREPFSLTPMTFRDPATGQPFPDWVTHYAELGVSIPEGEPGLNPASMSRSRNVRIVYAYGCPEGWRRP